MKRFYDTTKPADVERLRELAFASDEEDGDGVFSNSEEGEFSESDEEDRVLLLPTDEPQPSTSGLQPRARRARKAFLAVEQPPIVSSSESESEEDEEELVQPEPVPRVWVPEGNRRAEFRFQEESAGMSEDIGLLESPIEIFEYFFDKHLLEMISRETNRYANQQILEKTAREKMTPRSRDQSWIPTNPQEIMLLIGMLFLQGIIQKPKSSMFFFHERR